MTTDFEERNKVNETISDMLNRITNERHSSLLKCLAAEKNLFEHVRAEVQRKTGPWDEDDFWRFLLRVRATVAMLERPNDDRAQVERYAGQRALTPRNGSASHPRDLDDPEVSKSAARIPSPSLSPASLDALADQVEEERRRVNSGGGK